jgi:hypothetical protein
MSSFTITPKVNETQEFIEIAKDFSNPLDLVREAISNAFDAKANEIHISFTTEQINGERVLQINIQDNGSGMNKAELQSFFDLGNSTKRESGNLIGEKGHGTKVYFNSSRIEVITTKDEATFVATMDEPFKKLHSRNIPEVVVEQRQKGDSTLTGTSIKILGYNANRSDKFTHEILKDHILWFTKFGSPEQLFDENEFSGVTIHLKGLNKKEPEKLSFGHVFPNESKDIHKLFDELGVDAPDYYCRRWVENGNLRNFPEISYQAVFSVEGKKVRYDYNPMLRRRGYTPPEGAYTIQERYGLWLCKDFIPVQRKNEWITHKGSEYTKFHAFFNCQGLRLTANRSSIENTPSEILRDIEWEIRKLYDKIIESDDWASIGYLEDEVGAYKTKEKEKRDYERRIKKAEKANVAVYKDREITEPDSETGVYALFLTLSILTPDLFPFEIIDYNTHEGIDVIVKGNKDAPIYQNKLFYVEFKHYLKNAFNHSFENLHSIVCWDTTVKHGDTVSDINKEERVMHIVAPDEADPTTSYFLQHSKKPHRIQVFVLKDFLREHLDIQFRPRNSRIQ